MGKLEVGMVFRIPTRHHYGSFSITNIEFNKGKLLEMKEKIIKFDVFGYNTLDEKTVLELIESGYWEQVK